MATFKAIIRTKRSDNTYLVYIRCTHNRKIDYIKTDMYISEKKVKNGTIKDIDVVSKCAIKIKEWNDRLNRENIENWNVKEVVDFITLGKEDISFSNYCRKFIERMINEGREKSAANYQCAINSFDLKYGQMVTFQSIISKMIQDWIKALFDTARAKSA